MPQVTGRAPLRSPTRRAATAGGDMLMGIRSMFSRGAMNSVSADEQFDYIVVGGGTAGCVLANRLSALGDARVLVLEGGTASHKDKLVRIPVGILKLFKTDHDWDFTTAPQPSLKGREVYLCRGKGLGGSSCMNVMLYNRGAAQDYDDWAEECGDESWRAEHMIPYFKRPEDNLSKENSGVGPWHGADGPVAVSDVPYQNPLSRAFLRAAGQWGGTMNKDFNDWSKPQDGFGRYQVFQRNGCRVETASAYLDPVRKRSNLKVCVGTQVSGVRFDKGTGDKPRAVGAFAAARQCRQGWMVW